MLRRAPLFTAAALFASALTACASLAHAQDPRPDLKPPVVTHHVDAVYPAGAVVRGKHTDVVLAVTVDRDGNVSKVDVLQSGGKELDDAATAAVRQWRFKPATKDGQPIAARIRVPFHFAPLNAPAEIDERSPNGEAVVPGNVVSPGGGTGVTGPSSGAIGKPAGAAASATNESGDAHVHAATPPDVVNVHGRSQPPSRGASDFQIRVDRLGNVPRKNASDMLTLAPGILLTNEGGEGHAEHVFLRGFDAREGQDLELSVGGVPINEAGNLHGNGYADTHFIIPELVESIRVVEGPFDPRQGNFAVAGSADYELGLDRRGLTTKYTRGSYGSERMLLMWGPKHGDSHTFGAAELYKTSGFGQNRDARRGSAIGQYEGHFGDRGSYRVTGQAYTTTYHSAGVLREDDYDAGRVKFFDTYDTRQGGESSRFSVAADLEGHAGEMLYKQQLFFVSRAMRLRENFTGFLLDVQTPLQTPHGQRGDLLDLNVDETTIGARGSARLHTHALGEPQELELGYFARGDSVRGSQQRIEAATGNPYRTETDVESKLGDIGIYGDANVRPLSWLTLRGGARADLFTYSVLDKCAVQSVAHPSKTDPPGDASCLHQEDFGRYREPTQRSGTAATAVMPRGSVIVGPLQHFTLSASYGRGVRSIDPIYVTQDAATPFASVAAYEGGVTYAGGTSTLGVVARSIFFRTEVDRDLVFSETAGRNVLGGGTSRTGWVGALRMQGAFFDESANVTLVRSTFDDSHLLVPYVPDLVVRSDTTVFHDMPFSIAGERVKGTLSAGMTYVGHRPLPYGQRSDTIFTLDGQATLGWTNWELGLAMTNLFGDRYRLGEFNYASDFRSQAQPTLVPMRHFTAGAPRAVFVSIAATFGGS